MHLIPPKEQIQVLSEESLVAVGRPATQDSFEGSEEFFDRIGWPPSGHPVSLTAQAFFVALAGAFSSLRLIRSMYFCWAICSTLDSVQ